MDCSDIVCEFLSFLYVIVTVPGLLTCVILFLQ